MLVSHPMPRSHRATVARALSMMGRGEVSLFLINEKELNLAFLAFFFGPAAQPLRLSLSFQTILKHHHGLPLPLERPAGRQGPERPSCSSYPLVRRLKVRTSNLYCMHKTYPICRPLFILHSRPCCFFVLHAVAYPSHSTRLRTPMVVSHMPTVGSITV